MDRGEQLMQETDPKAVVEAYLQAFEVRDLSRCMELYDEDGLLIFGPPAFGLGRFQGKEAIKQWHKDRFSGGMRIVEIEEMVVEGDTVTVYAVATSPGLKAVVIDELRGMGTFVVQQGKIKEVRLGLRRGYRFHI